MVNTSIYLFDAYFLDNSYNHTVDFETISQQRNYFNNLVKYVIPDSNYHKKHNNVKVNKSYDDLQNCNYCRIVNKRGKEMYYFINDIRFISENSSELILQLDVIQTYLFDFKLNDGFVERCHSDRWSKEGNAILNVEEENLQLSEYVIADKTTVYDYKDKGGYIIASSDIMGVYSGGGSGDGDSSTSNGYYDGIISKNGFRFLKGHEAFSATAYDIGDGTRTIGYGVTEVYQKEYFDRLYPECTEKEASEVMAELVINNFGKPIINKLKELGYNLGKLNQNKFDALVSLAYNMGVYGMFSSNVFQYLINGRSDREIYDIWIVTGIDPDFEEGHTNRRKDEREIFLNNKYNMKPISGVDGDGYTPPIIENSNGTLEDRIINSARKLLGKPYIWGGNYPPLGNDVGTDCSGLCQWAYNDNGIRITRTTYTQINEGTEVTENQVKKGDLIFTRFSQINTPEHVFLYAGKDGNGNHTCIEAPTENEVIRERTFIWTTETRARRLL